MMPTDTLFTSSSSSSENGFTTLDGSTKPTFARTTHSNAPESSVEMSEYDLQAIGQPGESKTIRAGISLAERRSTTQTPLQLSLAQTHPDFADSHTQHKRSQAIDIPIVRRIPREPTTPLTARAEKSGNFSYFQPSHGSPLRSPSLRPKYYLTPVRRDFTASSMPLEDSPSSGSTTSSPLSTTSATSTTPIIPFQSTSFDSLRIHRQRLNQTGPSTSGPATQLAMDPDTPTKPKSPSLGRMMRSPQTHQRQVSDAQRKLQQYQRDLIENATRTSGSLISGGRLEKPETPHLKACGSPGTGPATPLLLEEPGDYLSARVSRSTDYLSAGLARSSAGAADGLSRDLVDQLLRREERRQTSGLSPQGGSPAVSPAGGPGF